MTVVFFNLGLLGLPSSATSDTPRGAESPAAAPAPFLHQQHPPDFPSTPGLQAGGLGGADLCSLFHKASVILQQETQTKPLVPAGHGTAPRQPSPPWQRPPARGAVIPTWSNTASGQASSCWAAGSKRRVLFSCCHRFRPKCCFICLRYCFSRSAGGAAAALPRGRASP